MPLSGLAFGLLDLVLVVLLLVGIPVLVLMILAGAAEYVRQGAEEELARLEAEGELAEPPADPDADDWNGIDDVNHEEPAADRRNEENREESATDADTDDSY